MTDSLVSGDGSALRNTWEEICVQVQYEQSYAWDQFDETVHALTAKAWKN